MRQILAATKLYGEWLCNFFFMLNYLILQAMVWMQTWAWGFTNHPLIVILLRKIRKTNWTVLHQTGQCGFPPWLPQQNSPLMIAQVVFWAGAWQRCFGFLGLRLRDKRCAIPENQVKRENDGTCILLWGGHWILGGLGENLVVNLPWANMDLIFLSNHTIVMLIFCTWW